MDEAFSALDYQTRLAVADDVYAILKREGVTTLMVTHDIPESISMGDRVVMLSSRPARIRRSFHRLRYTYIYSRLPQPPALCRLFDHIWKELKRDETT